MGMWEEKGKCGFQRAIGEILVMENLNCGGHTDLLMYRILNVKNFQRTHRHTHTHTGTRKMEESE